MANLKSSKRSIKKSRIQRKLNLGNRSKLRTFIKKVCIAIKNNEKDNAEQAFITMQKTIDQQTTKGLIKKNKANRYKSNLFKKIKQLSTN